MKLSPSGLMEHARTDEGRKQLRYAGISVVFVPLGQVLIQIFALFIHNRHGNGNFVLASVLSAAILTFPNFYANKRWVWHDKNRDNLRTQVIVFWVAAMLGVGLATLLTYYVEEATKHQSHIIQGGCVFIAQLVGFGIAWIGRYFVLDKWIFKVSHHGDEPTDEQLAELHHDFPV